MSGRWGRGVLSIIILIILIICISIIPTEAAGPASSGEWSGLRPLEVQLLAPHEDSQAIRSLRPFSLGQMPETEELTEAPRTTSLRLTPATEIKLSFLYRQDQSGSSAGTDGHLLFRYSMDYLVMPNLRVGLSGYLYKPPAEYQYWRPTQPGDPVLGIGPGVKYDLGRWSFLLRTQVEKGSKQHGEAIHNWFRVWYSF